jgi:hypothetical protein
MVKLEENISLNLVQRRVVFQLVPPILPEHRPKGT